MYLIPSLRKFPLKFSDRGSALIEVALEKKHEFGDICINLDTISLCDGQTERIAKNAYRAVHAICIPTCDKIAHGVIPPVYVC